MFLLYNGTACSLHCVTLHCLLHRAWGGVTKEKNVKHKVWSTVVCHFGPYFGSVPLLCPARILPGQILADHPSFKSTSTSLLTCSDGFLSLILFHFGFPMLRENRKCLIIFIRGQFVQTHGWLNHIYQPPPLGQDMTQGQFLSGVSQVWIQSFPSPRLVASPGLKNLVCPTIYP